MIFALLMALCAAADGLPSIYELQNLRPSGFSQYNEAGLNRIYIDFQNESGTHHLLYEEVPTALPLKDVETLRSIAIKSESSCEIVVQCNSKAFCTADCKNMYYEFTNAAVVAADRNRCTLQSYSCEKRMDTRTPSSVSQSVVTAAPSVQAQTSATQNSLAAPSIANLKENVNKMEADPLAGQNFDE